MDEIRWDESQQAVLEHLSGRVVLSVLGGAASGKTELLKEAAVRVLERDPQARVAVLAPDRRAANQLRNDIALRLGAVGQNLAVKSVNAFAYSILSAYAQGAGRAAPELISGADQDALLRDIFELVESGSLGKLDARVLAKAGISLEATRLPAFRAEFRDLITRAAELGISAQDLASLDHVRPIWAVGAEIMARYEQALALQAGVSSRNPDRVDNARVITGATQAYLRGLEEVSPTLGGKLNVQLPRWDWVFVDDVQNATLALAKLLGALSEDGANVVTFGNPDQGVQGYRGGISALPVVLSYPRGVGGIGAQVLNLEYQYRPGGKLGKLEQIVKSGIHTGAASAYRKTRVAAPEMSGGDGENVRSLSFPNDTEEIEYVASVIKDLHAQSDTSYSDIAIITRSRSMHGQIRRIFERHHIPVEPASLAATLKEQVGAGSVLAIAKLAVGDAEALEAQQVTDVLSGPAVRIDPTKVRSIGQQLRSQELAQGGARTLDELWKGVVSHPEDPLYQGEVGLGRFTAAILGAREAERAGAASAEVLWQVWEKLELADEWRSRALTRGEEARFAHEALDSVLQLFKVASRFDEREGEHATIHAFLDYVEAQDLPEDSVAPQGGSTNVVSLLTPAGTPSRTWAHVFVMGVNEGVWPDTRLRNPLTHVPELVSTVVGSILAGRSIEPTQLRSEVIDDELRMLYQSITRARESLTLTCVESDDTLPSSIFEWLESASGGELKLVHQQVSVQVPGVHALVADLARAYRYGDSDVRGSAEEVLDYLAKAGFTEADRKFWVDLLEMELAEEESQRPVTISPSGVDSMIKCPLRATLEKFGARDADNTQAIDIGNLMHLIAQLYPEGERDQVEAALERWWPRLGLDETSLAGKRVLAKLRTMAEAYITYAQHAEGSAVTEVDATIDGTDIDRPYNVRARLDRIEVLNDARGTVRIVDFKTGKTTPTQAELLEHPQLAIYQWLVDSGAIKLEGVRSPMHSVGAQLVYLAKGLSAKGEARVLPQAEAGAKELENTLALLDEAYDAMRRPDFEARPDTGDCQSCMYKAICPAFEGGRIFS